MDRNGLLDIGLVIFVFTPLALTIALLICLWWRRINKERAPLPVVDAPEMLLAGIVRSMPERRREWGAAMINELRQVDGLSSRWRFALACARVALFPPGRSGGQTGMDQSPVCGALAVALPPLALPLLYFAALIMDAVMKQEGVSLSAAYPGLQRAILFGSVSCVLAGFPLGLAGLWRRERLRKLSIIGLSLPIPIIGYFLIVMSLMAGGPHGD